MRQNAVSPSPGIEEITKAMPGARKCLSPECGCCQRSDILLRINEELLQHKLQLEEQNRNLLEEIQVSRRFYQGTLADLTAQLSIGKIFIIFPVPLILFFRFFLFCGIVDNQSCFKLFTSSGLFIISIFRTFFSRTHDFDIAIALNYD